MAVVVGCTLADEKAVVHTSAGGGPSDATVLPPCGEKVEQAIPEPSVYTLSCETGRTVKNLESLIWSEWGGSVAEATGHVRYDPCTPRCDASKTIEYDVIVKASDAVNSEALWFYRILEVTVVGAVPDGVPAAEHYDLGERLDTWSQPQMENIPEN